MGDRLPRVTGKEVVSALCRLGFQLHHVTGSHHVLRSASGRQLTVPVHAGGVVGPGLLKRITEQAGVTVEQLREKL